MYSLGPGVCSASKHVAAVLPFHHLMGVVDALRCAVLCCAVRAVHQFKRGL